LEWVERYHGYGGRGFREETRAEYRSLLTTYALAFFGRGERLGDITPKRVAEQKGEGQVIGALKSGHARRDLPISLELADELRTHVAGREPDDLVFPSPYERRKPYDPAHLWTRVLHPACAEAGVAWAGFHTFRHTVAARKFHAGRTAVQVQHWLGHHSAAFTLKTYGHLLDADDLGGPLTPVETKQNLADEVEQWLTSGSR
jgi:integrase